MSQEKTVITPDMTLVEVLSQHRQTEEVFRRYEGEARAVCSAMPCLILWRKSPPSTASTWTGSCRTSMNLSASRDMVFWGKGQEPEVSALSLTNRSFAEQRT